MQAHPRRPLQRGQRLDGGAELHAVVGGVELSPAKLQLAVAEDQQRAPAAGPGFPEQAPSV